MATKWYHNAMTGEIDSYQVDGELTDFSRGLLMAYGDYLTTGLKSQEDAEAWAQEWHACPKCESVRHGQVDDPCLFCGTLLIAPSS